jgi:hypothetical protein|tara:strand:- start:5230 stop:5766 length:537 start_codon:yes stop_codon:yes gene_type:complete
MNTNLLDIWNLNSLWRLLSSIQVGDKVSIRGNLICVDRNTPFLFMKRKYYGDKREDLHQFITYLFEITEYHLKEENYVKKQVDSFLQNILSGIKSLINLRETYCDDVRFLAIYNSSLEKISILKKYYLDKDNYKVFLDIESNICQKNSPSLSSISRPVDIDIINNENGETEIFKTPNE